MSRNKKQTQAVETEQKTAMPPAENNLPRDNIPSPPQKEMATNDTADKTENLTDGAKSENDETPKDDAKALEAAPPAGTSEMLDEKADEEGLIDPIAFEITLKSHHPQATYGRCGYRFNKETAVEIPSEALTGEQIIMLAEDPWLEFVPVVEA